MLQLVIEGNSVLLHVCDQVGKNLIDFSLAERDAPGSKSLLPRPFLDRGNRTIEPLHFLAARLDALVESGKPLRFTAGHDSELFEFKVFQIFGNSLSAFAKAFEITHFAPQLANALARLDAGDQILLNLRRAFEDGQKRGISVPLRNRVIVHVTGATENLHSHAR